MAADFDRRIANASDTLSRDTLDRQLHATPDTPDTDELTEDPLIDRMARVPDEADFTDVLSPEGNSGDIVGSSVSSSTTVSDASIAGTG